jgi:hypothetical protein
MREGGTRGVQRVGERSIKITEMGRQKTNIKGQNIRGYVVDRKEKA